MSPHEKLNLKPSESALWNLCPMLVTRWRTPFSIYFPSSKFTICLILCANMTLFGHNTADPCSMQDECHVKASQWPLLTIESLWLIGKASEQGIWRSEVQFLVGTQNSFFVPHSWKDQKHLSLFLYSKLLPSLLTSNI